MTDKIARSGGEVDLERALAGLGDARAPATRRAYEAAWRDWLAYAERSGIPPSLPVEPGYLLAWLSACEERGLSVDSLRSRVAAMRAMHARSQSDPTTDPDVALFVAAAARRAAQAGRRREPKRALTAQIVREVVREASARDRAILLVGYVSGCRRSELAALTWADVEEEGEALVLVVRTSKTDQQGVGRRVGIPRNDAQPDLCPVRALRAWQRVPLPPGTTTHRRVFRCSGRTIARVVQRACARAGLDPADFGAHSMRRGMITDARRAGVYNREIMHQSGHRSESSLATYTESVDASENPAARAVVDALNQGEKK